LTTFGPIVRLEAVDDEGPIDIFRAIVSATIMIRCGYFNAHSLILAKEHSHA
jgi:hypothetical protein